MAAPHPLFQRIHDEIEGADAAATGSLREGTFAAQRWGTLDVSELGRAVRELVHAWTELYAGLGGAVGFGSDDEIVACASRGTLLVRVHHASGRYVAVVLSDRGNLGYLRFRMRDYLRAVLAE